MRAVLGAQFEFLAATGWRIEDVKGHGEVLQEGPLSLEGRVPAGVVYHVLDVFVDCLDKGREVAVWPEGMLEELLAPVRSVHRLGSTKEVRRRAGEVLGDERVLRWAAGQKTAGHEDDAEEDEFAGFDD